MKKEIEVIMLPTGKNLNHLPNMFTSNGNLFTNGNQIGKYLENDNDLIEHHLYFLSDEEIKDGDWFIDTTDNTLWQNKHKKSMKKSIFPECKKIIATTDTSLNTEEFTGVIDESNGIKEVIKHSLPYPSQTFIKQYLETGCIDKVFVEYEGGCCGRCIEGIDECIPTEYKPKVNSNNEITIHPIKISWNREEVIKLCKKAVRDNCNLSISQQPYNSEEVKEFEDTWIKENLK